MQQVNTHAGIQAAARVVQRCSDAVVQWCSGAVVQWCSGAVMQLDHGCHHEAVMQMRQPVVAALHSMWFVVYKGVGCIN